MLSEVIFMSVGQRIKERRKQLGMSAETLAELIGVSPTTIYRYESGDIEKVDVAKMIPLADALKTTPGNLMGWEDTQEKLHDIGQQLTAPARSKKWRILSEGLAEMDSEAEYNAAFEATFAYLTALYPDIFKERTDDDAHDPES